MRRILERKGTDNLFRGAISINYRNERNFICVKVSFYGSFFLFGKEKT